MDMKSKLVVLVTGLIPVPKPMSVKIQWETQELQEKLKSITEDLDEKIAAIFEANQAWAMAWMKLNAPWTDDTGAAREGLTATAYSNGSSHEMLLAYSVNYGIWLEVANSGRFQILGPAMRYVSQKILKDMNDIFKSRPTAPGMPSGRDIPPVARKAKPHRKSGGSNRSRKAYGSRRRVNVR